MRREQLRVSGIVQGVGFRPFVWRLAQRFGLTGEVRNDASAVRIDVQGTHAALSAFRAALAQEAPPLARIDAIDTERAQPLDTAGRPGFRIVESGETHARDGEMATDSAICYACLAEIFDAGDRRHRYALNSCCDCGPRYTVTRTLPFDRANTSMAPFAPCADCAADYADPANRRFHAELIACPVCGPRVRFEAPLGSARRDHADHTDPVADAWRAIARGEIVAVEGLGGFQLICDATQPDAVARLRARKRRPAKPFALLALNAASAARWIVCDAATRALLDSPARPVVVAARCDDHALSGIAPGLAQLGVMLPCTPLQYLLFHEALGRPSGDAWRDANQPTLLVATSANVSGEPLEIDPAHARDALAGIADAMLFHDRAIVARCDDSVLLAANADDADHADAAAPQAPLPLRRARGYAPQALALPHAGPSVLALGAHLKSTVTLTQGARAFVSPYLGDLTSAAACAALDAAANRLVDACGAPPAALACDLQPDLYSTRLAHTLAARWNVPVVPVQHHHAHIAAVLAEHGHADAALGVALDGFGHGDDGTAWGGELLRVDPGRATRLGHLTPLALPGGDLAARSPARMALALLDRLDRLDRADAHASTANRTPPGIDAATAARLRAQLASGFHCPPTTSLGRWFDAIAGLAGVCAEQSYSGEAALRLEALARPCAPLVDGWRLDGGNLDLLPLTHWFAAQTEAATIASVWHATLGHALGAWIAQAARAHNLNVVALGGGCCANRLLMRALADALRTSNLTLFTARALPSGDDAISYGQAWAVIQQLTSSATVTRTTP
ncbi:carbamoyltransferase HypF [Paraburkholderia tropica]|uniref:Carbamoyltransferase HypF n=1 Tax=Paraburkholderia tropica TaxID=92647 RepID=A0ABX5MY71_9BURK|nr:carbamoyltransferase HypF [Paraburkholderia tropica]MDE1139177.1 carbamoyltransferase HypF [Paraburkholderia tropica]PXX19622.1 hydrogenase maturation carbamoyltransferase HypF [Paraburkholderia tropica]PZW88563.1 hydrogenase maturation carbamoyltransferase HypF [Paraburkholderia tropica]